MVELALILFPKKLNRYIVPAFPALNVLAAAGLVWGAAWLAQIRRAGAQAQRWAASGVVAGVALLAVANAAWWHPYSIAYFNQALGGAQAGAWAFLIGSGEGLEQAAAWLNQQPDITGVVTASTMPPPLQPYLKPGAQTLSRRGDQLPEHSGYAVVYVRNVWDGGYPPFDRFYPNAPPRHVVTIHGVEYAWIYEVPPPIANPLDVRFGSDIALTGYEVDITDMCASGTLSLTVQWHPLAPVDTDYMLFVHLLNAEGQRVAQIDAPPAGDTPTSAWETGHYRTWVHPLPVPPDLPPGDYWLALGLYHPETFARLPVSVPAPPGAPDAGGDALLLPVTIE
jgi:hypothetical protein